MSADRVDLLAMLRLYYKWLEENYPTWQDATLTATLMGGQQLVLPVQRGVHMPPPPPEPPRK